MILLPSACMYTSYIPAELKYVKVFTRCGICCSSPDGWSRGIRRGKQHRQDVFGANYIVTPTEKNTPEAIETIIERGRLLGFSNVTTLSPEEHDEMIGFLSQLTHCIAITLMTCNNKENMEKFTGDSFRDLTRIARINDLMWSELFEANKDVLLEQMNWFIGKFNDLKTMLERDDIDGMRAMMRHSTERRALFDKK